MEVKNRAYNDQRAIDLSCDFMASVGKESSSGDYLTDVGYWDSSLKRFVSQLFVWICLADVQKDNTLHVDWDSNKDEALQQVILRGWSRMKESDFCF